MRIVMDAAGDVPADLAEELNIYVIPVNIMFGTEEFLSDVTMDHKAFYQKVGTVGDHNFPKTSQPTPYQFERAYEEIIAEGEDEILTITVSEKLSGTYASAVAASRSLANGAKFHLYDSKAGSALQGIMAIEAARMSRGGDGIEPICQRLDQILEESATYFLIDSLEYAVRGGRVSSLRSTMASLLNIKPVMTLEDGLIVEAGKVRTYKKAIDYIINAVKADVDDRPSKLAIIHAGKPNAGQALLDKARPYFKITEEFLTDMAIAVAINLGPGALGMIAVPEAGAT